MKNPEMEDLIKMYDAYQEPNVEPILFKDSDIHNIPTSTTQDKSDFQETNKKIVGIENEGFVFEKGEIFTYKNNKMTVKWVYNNDVPMLYNPTKIKYNTRKQFSKFQKRCCVYGCCNIPSGRQRSSLKTMWVRIRKDMIKNGFNKVCNSCYFRDSYIRRKKRKRISLKIYKKKVFV